MMPVLISDQPPTIFDSLERAAALAACAQATETEGWTYRAVRFWLRDSPFSYRVARRARIEVRDETDTFVGWM